MPIPRNTGTEQTAGADDDASPTPVMDRVKTVGKVHWEPLTEDRSKYVISIVQGLDQSGKTHFAFSAPAPILCMTFDPGNIRRGVARAYEGKDIQLAVYETPKGLVSTPALAAAAKVVQDNWEATYLEAVHGKYFKTIILDREDETWELFRFDEFNGRQSQKAHNFTPLNSHYKALLKLAEKNKKNLIMIDAVADEWKNEKPTGRMKKLGFKWLGMLSQLTLEAQVDDHDNFSLQVIRCRDDATKNGKVLTPQTISVEMEALGYEYPTDEAGEAVWFPINFENVMTHLIGGTVDDWR